MNKPKNANWLVITDLDGTLLDHEYDLTPALTTLNWLRNEGIPVIPCTSKTASEVVDFRKVISSTDPYIVENGGAIYGLKGENNKELELILGRPYEELRPVLNHLSKDIDYPLKALKDISNEEVHILTGLTGQAISKAKERLWSVPFLNPPKDLIEKLISKSHEYNVKIYQGNLMCHLICEKSDKGRAVLELKRFINQSDIRVLALGDSHNDLPLLRAADIAAVIPGKSGPNQKLINGLKGTKYQIATKPHAEGWAEIIKNNIYKS